MFTVPANASNDELQFRLGSVGQSNLNVVSATMFVLVRHRKGSGHSATGANATDGAGPHHQRIVAEQNTSSLRGLDRDRGRRITIYVYQVESATAAKPEAVSNKISAGFRSSTLPAPPIAQLTANIRRTLMQRLLLPTTVVQESIDARSPVLRLRVVCPACDGDTSLVLRPSSSTAQRRRHRRRGGQTGRGERRRDQLPYLVIRVKERAPNPATAPAASAAMTTTSATMSRTRGRSLRRRV
jgi:hypothetical protein